MDKSSIMDVIKVNLTEALTDVITSKKLVERSEKILYVDENQQSINDDLSLEEREFPEAYLKEWYRQTI
ncbi:hypothetical protein [Listeria monocytogenes]|uniref:hypothetical protein n=1 Tax=Listeria monocytogenes TaxID=1639 RepID=UPI000A42B800|nr:hypothetical protein [Listeria monocytogenes]